MTTLPSKPPSNETRQRVLEAAIACVKQWGIEKTSLLDIARQAGVTRPTVYRYFTSREDVLSAALLQSAAAMARRLIAHIEGEADPAERFVRAILFLLDDVPKEPQLSVMTLSSLATYVSEDALINAEGFGLSLLLMKQILAGVAMTEDEWREVTEATIRMLLSLLNMAGPVKRDEEQMRGFIMRRMLPMTGLPRKS
ncbi:TetR/AcrR family transcriptional regulator [Zavarzinia sp.]|uniref:TetR/AcrR family transcriptional regulator n=1 Tax=Zavarzinia sp. TaxID=2027920 RepID=UPI003BB7D785